VGAFKDLTGQTFGRLFVLKISQKGKKKKPIYWLCRCKCGVEKSICGKSLKSGLTESCGCLKIELFRQRETTHGLSGTSEYSSWKNMVQRCNNPEAVSYPRYGGRGIKICDGWNPAVGGTFEKFLKDMGRKPSPQHSIERDNRNGNYELSNCKWATRADQAHNTSRVKLDSTAVLAIRQMSEAGASNRMIATHFGIKTARRVVSGDRWVA